jgi:hypothetical protein
LSSLLHHPIVISFFFGFVSILAHLVCMSDRSHVVREYLLVVIDRSCLVNSTTLFPLNASCEKEFRSVSLGLIYFLTT